jgi:predicted alpha/beta-hydrolase family hydrolase
MGGVIYMKSIQTFLVALALTLGAIAAHAGEVTKLPTREGVSVNIYWHETPNAKATVLILPGGGGGFGRIENGLPSSNGFLVRTSPQWIEEGFNYAAFGMASDLPELDYPVRVSEKHLTDLKATIEWLKTKTNTPIWLVGTSRGTISASHLLINTNEPQIAGGVLTASVTSPQKIGAVPTLELAKIKVPMLVFHHSNDACQICKPSEVPAIMSGLKNAPIKKLVMVSGGTGATGSPCEAMHYHGFISIERESVHAIADWIRRPTN